MEEDSAKQISNDKDNFNDFQDFDDEEIETPELEADLIEQEEKSEENAHEGDLLDDAQSVLKLQQEIIAMNKNQNTKELETAELSEIQETETPKSLEEDSIEQVEAPEEQETETKEEISKEPEKENIINPELPAEPDGWEELSEDNSVVKKYIVYVAKEFVPLMDELTTDERSAYINDAIQRKIDLEEEISNIDKKRRILTHVIITVLTFLIFTPIALFVVNKSIMATFENYKYSQDNFEKLYKQRFEKDRAYMRSIEYNRLHSKDVKKEQ